MKRRVDRIPRIAALAASLALAAAAAQANEREALETLRQTTLNLIQLLVQQGVLPAAQAEQLVKDAEAKARAAVEAQKRAEQATVRVPYVPEVVRRQIADEVREEVVAKAKAERWGDVNAVPEWVDRFKFEGDMRFGYQRDMFADSNAPEPLFQVQGQSIENTTEDRDRLRLRARLGVTARVTEDVTASLRLATGNASDPVSTNQTLGNDSRKLSFALDRAFLRLRFADVVPELTTSLGRIPNPFFRTDLVWDDDLGFDGVAFQYAEATSATGSWRPFATLGVFPLQEVQRSLSNDANSKWLLGAQAGIDWDADRDVRVRAGLGYYDYRNVSGVRNAFGSTTTNATAPGFRQKGNTLFNIDNDGDANTNLWALAADYRLVNLTGMLDFRLGGPTHLIVDGDFVRNVGFSRRRMLARSGLDVEPATTGYMARLTLGMPTISLRGDWQLQLAYRYLEADAVLDAHTDSDFHLGGTNNKGFIVGGQYGLSRNTWLNARWLSSREISGLPLSIDVFQLYFNAKF